MRFHFHISHFDFINLKKKIKRQKIKRSGKLKKAKKKRRRTEEEKEKKRDKKEEG